MSFNDLPFFSSGGATGESGKDGVSPTISITDIEGGHRLTIVDVTGSKTIDIMNGIDGKSGVDGTNGTNGLTPSINASGNWQIGSTDTGVKAKGIDGKDGNNGTNGRGIKAVTISEGDLVVTYTDDISENIGRVVGETGGQGPAYTLTDEDRASIVDAVLAELNTQN